MIVILNKIEVITTYGKLLYEAINKEVVMKKIVDRYTNNIFENIKHMEMNIGMLENFQKFQNIKTGETS